MQMSDEYFSNAHPINFKSPIDNFHHNIAVGNMIVPGAFAARDPNGAHLFRRIVCPNGNCEISKCIWCRGYPEKSNALLWPMV